MKHLFYTDSQIILHSCAVIEYKTFPLLVLLNVVNCAVSPKKTRIFNTDHNIQKSHGIKSGDQAGQTIVSLLPNHSAKLSF